MRGRGRSGLSRLRSWHEDTNVTASDRLPRRRLQLSLTLGADTLADLATELRLIGETLFVDGRENREVACGGPNSGYQLSLSCDAEMTAAQFREDLEAWRRQQVEGGGA